MRQGIGATATFNIVIIFMVIVFGLLIGSVNYYKAFKVNARILDIIDKYEGYNYLSKNEIENFLDSMGYIKHTPSCDGSKRGATLEANNNTTHDYCVYYFADDRGNNDPNTDIANVNKEGEPRYYNYSVLTYIYIDLPIINIFKLPVYTKGERIYNFSSHK